MQQLMPLFESIRQKQFSEMSSGGSLDRKVCLKHPDKSGNGGLVLYPVKRYKLPVSTKGVKMSEK